MLARHLAHLPPLHSKRSVVSDFCGAYLGAWCTVQHPKNSPSAVSSSPHLTLAGTHKVYLAHTHTHTHTVCLK